MSFDYGKYFGEIKLTHDLLSKKEERTWLLKPPRDGERHDVVLYLGCNVLRTSHLVETVGAVFDRLGLDYVAAGGPTYCCGIQHHRRGQEASGERYANHTVELLQSHGPARGRHVVPLVHPVLRRGARRPTCRSRSATPPSSSPTVSTAGSSRSPSGSRPPWRCTTTTRPRPGRARGGPRGGCWRRCPGVNVIEFEPDARWGRTCTPALQEQLGPEVWRQMALDDIDRALGAGATHLAGIYHGCHRDQCRFERERPIVVEHYLTLFARALGIEFEDTYKKYMHMGDPDRILEDASPCMAANGVDPEKARGLVIKTFSA